MENQLADRALADHSLTDTNPEKEKGKCLIACPIFKKELERVLTELSLAPHIHYMHYSIHINPVVMDEQLRESVHKAAANGEEVRLLVGKHCKGKRDMAEVADDCGGRIPQARNCIDMLIGEELAKKLQKNRSSLMTPAWVRMITQSIADGQWSVTDARLNLGWYNKIIILDTGVDPLTDEQIMEFYDLTQVEIDIVAVDLDHFKHLMQDLLQ